MTAEKAKMTLQPGQVTLRYIRLGSSSSPGAVQVLNGWFVPQPYETVNGRAGFQSGNYERRMGGEEGRFSLTFPNAPGADGQLHRERFLILQNGLRDPTSAEGAYGYTGGTYRPGDEWFEIYWSSAPGGPRTLLFVGTPVEVTVNRTEITLTGYDALWLLKKQRSLSTDFWEYAPRDVLEDYTKAWVTVGVQEFTEVMTYSSNPVTISNTADGNWSWTWGGTTIARPGAFRMLIPAGSGPSTGLTPSTFWPRAANTWKAPLDSLSADGAVNGYRVEFDIADVQYSYDTNGRSSPNADSAVKFLLGIKNLDASDYFAVVQFGWSALTGQIQAYFWGNVEQGSGGGKDYTLAQDFWFNTTASITAPTAPFQVAIEKRGPFVSAYINGSLIGMGFMTSGLHSGNDNFAPFMQTNFFIDVGGAATVRDSYIDCAAIRFYRLRPFLMRDGTTPDYRLPGAPTPGGLIGRYYPFTASPGITTIADILRLPDGIKSEPYADRLDGPLNFSGTPATWQPPGPKNFTARWTGAIFLDLATADKFLRITADDMARLWVGKTRLKEEAAVTTRTPGAPTYPSQSSAATASLRTHLGSTTAGWYPIIIDYLYATGDTGGASKFLLERSPDGAAWTTVPYTELSPYGIFINASRGESHFDMVKTIADNWAYQFTVVPKQLESGGFPGQIYPRARLGRDTEKVLTAPETTDVSVRVNAEQVADLLYADAAGLGDDKEVSQISASVFNVSEGPNHPWLSIDQESLTDIGNPNLLAQRLNALMALRGSAWEETNAAPRGFRELLDKFPLVGSVTEFAWEPGDGVRLSLPEIGVEDATPRQILGLQQEFVPDGLSAPSASFRQRPRALKETLRQMAKASAQNQRNYQGQFVTWSGQMAGTNMPTTYSSIVLPDDLSKLVKAEVVVAYKGDTSAWKLQINDNDFSYEPLVTIAKRIDVTSRAVKTSQTDPRMYAQFVDAGSSTGGILYQLLVTVAI